MKITKIIYKKEDVYYCSGGIKVDYKEITTVEANLDDKDSPKEVIEKLKKLVG